MFKSLASTAFLVASLAATNAFAQEQSTTYTNCAQEDCEGYPVMAKQMSEVGGGLFWESHKVTTEDGYILTLFRIVGDENGDHIDGQGSKGPLFLQHGFLTDSVSWFNLLTEPDELAAGSQLFLEGYDVWFGNIRGSRNSREHETFDPDEDDYEFWDFSFEEFGLLDMPAMLGKVKEVSTAEGSCKKITYVGHSQGNIMAFYGLSYAPSASKYLSQFVALAPCFIGSFEDYFSNLDEGTYRLFHSALYLFGIESMFGPAWSEQMATLCALLGEDSEECILMRGLPLGPIHEMGSETGYQEVGIKQALHMVQNNLENRFQDYADYYIFGSWFQRQKLVPLEDIDVPVKYMYMEQDSICPVEYSRQFAQAITTGAEEVTLDRLHGAPTSSNDPEFMAALRSLLTNSGEEMSYQDCYDSDFNWY